MTCFVGRGQTGQDISSDNGPFGKFPGTTPPSLLRPQTGGSTAPATPAAISDQSQPASAHAITSTRLSRR